MLIFPVASMAQNKSVKDNSATVPDISVMSFRIDKYEVADKIDIVNIFNHADDTTVPVPKGERFVIVTLIGSLDGLREKYKMVPKFHKQFAALFDDGKEKKSSDALMVKGLFGWGGEGRFNTWALGNSDDPAHNNEEEFTVAFELPLEWNQFKIAVKKLDGSGGYVLAGTIDLNNTKH